MPKTLIIRHHTQNYDNPQSLSFENTFDVVDLHGKLETTEYLMQMGYNNEVPNDFMANRLVKFLPNANYDLKVYLDSSIHITDLTAFKEMIEGMNIKQFNIALCEHPDRNTLLEELKTCYKCSKITKSQYDAFAKSNKVLNCSQKLTQNGLLMMRSTEEIKKWSINFLQYLQSSCVFRDQILLPLYLQENALSGIHYYNWPKFVRVKPHNLTLQQKITKKLNYLRRKFVV